ncbi:MAG: hypothetical protein EA377_04420 [Phycisphaerales bacterium]|nr:MAG: hypothetical protein EA377_04420 [Phycisphaerales bacterium]
MAASPRKDRFPTTARSWIDGQLGRGAEGLAETNHHIMSMYGEPLKAYYNGSSFRSMGEPDDVIASFFADRLGRADFLDHWQASGRKLRHWLIVAFRYFLMEQRATRSLPMERRQVSDTRATAEGNITGGIVDDSARDAEEIFHSEVARSLVRRAMVVAEQQCAADDLHVHWQIWARHTIDGCSFPDLSEEFDRPAVRLKVMSRTVSNRFRQVIRELLAWPGALPHQLDEEIRELMSDLAKGED